MQRTKWDGIVDEGCRGSGFFRVDERDGVFWLVDPDGGRFLSKGVNTVRFDQDRVGTTGHVPYADACRKKYGSQHIWRAAAANRLASWKFNTLGCWSDELVARADVAALFQEPVDAVNATLAPFQRIKRFALIPSEFTIAGGEVTPTMKVKPRVVEERWRAIIEKLYEGNGPQRPTQLG